MRWFLLCEFYCICVGFDFVVNLIALVLVLILLYGEGILIVFLVCTISHIYMFVIMIKVIFKIKFAMMILIDEMIELIMYLISNLASILTLYKQSLK